MILCDNCKPFLSAFINKEFSKTTTYKLSVMKIQIKHEDWREDDPLVDIQFLDCQDNSMSSHT